MTAKTVPIQPVLPSRSGRLGWHKIRSVLLVVAFAALFIIAVFPGIFTPYSPGYIDSSAILQPPSWKHPFGTDEAGADVWTRVLFATRLEAQIAFGSVIIALCIGVPLGLIAGVSRRIFDWSLTSLANATLAFPIVLFAILMVASFGTTPLSLTIIIGFLFFPRVFLLMRAQTKSIREREFITATRVVGAHPLRILSLHILPNSVGPLATLVPQLMAEAVLIEAGLSYLGLGVPLPQATWGTILEASKDYYVTAPFYAVVAGLTITVVAALSMYAGDIIAESRNPLRKRRVS